MNLEKIEDLMFSIENENQELLEGCNEWSLLRNRLYMNMLKILEKEGAKSKSSEVLNSRFLSNLFYGFKNWFKSYDILVFTNNQYRKKINDIYFDRVLDPFISEEDKKRTLFLSLTNTTFYPMDKIHSKHVVSQTILDLIGYLFVKLRPSSKKDSIGIEKILEKHENINFNVKQELRQFYGYYYLYRFFFKLYKPKKIFVATYYSATRNYMVKAANDLKIPVIEGQHGYIGNAHPSYNCKIKLDASYIPSELWVFSEFDKEILREKGVYAQNQIKVKGDYFLDQIKEIGRKESVEMEPYVDTYQYRVGISLQIPLESVMVPFFIRTAELNRDILYIFIPRIWNNEYENLELPENVIFVKESGFYDTILWCTHHSTVFSTTAFEADYLGFPNVLVDIQGLASKYFGTVFPEETIVTEENQLIKQILR